ncbi:MAG TPA: methylmalonyl-CoA mutase family protein [Saprospiraceae bacterium]|nr:methylmalonyl-CoA mutase family protein [Saprospiraceae bacterium]
MEFRKYDLSEWEELVISELKHQKTFEDLCFTIDGITINPLNPIDPSIEFLPIYRERPTRSGLAFSKNFDTIAQCLEWGPSALRLFLQDGNYPRIEGVLWNMLDVELVGIEKDTDHFIKINGLSQDISTINPKQYVDVNFEVPFPENCTLLIDTLNIDNAAIFININLSNDFYKNIAGLRALRLFLSHFKHEKNRSLQARLSVTIPTTAPSATPENTILEYTYKVIAAYMGGADYVFQQVENTDFDRIAFHIQNLLNLESKITNTQDVVAGSPFFEKLTQNILETLNDRYTERV